MTASGDPYLFTSSMTSHTSSPVPATWARRPAGPSTKTTPGNRRDRRASSRRSFDHLCRRPSGLPRQAPNGFLCALSKSDRDWLSTLHLCHCS